LLKVLVAAVAAGLRFTAQSIIRLLVLIPLEAPAGMVEGLHLPPVVLEVTEMPVLLVPPVILAVLVIPVLLVPPVGLLLRSAITFLVVAQGMVVTQAQAVPGVLPLPVVVLAIGTKIRYTHAVLLAVMEV
jgi:hypothetical protein